jgi:tetratricopeptide (TPR) repeat protein
MTPPSLAPARAGPLSAVAVSQWRSAVLAEVLPPRGVFDAQAMLERHPDLRAAKSLVLDVALEEYSRRREAGESVELEEFCSRFPTYRASVGRLLQVASFLGDESFLLDGGAPVAWPSPGEEFLGFALDRELGRGSFARVYLAREPDLGDRSVAVKVSARGGGEAATLGRLNHPNIVPIYSVKFDGATGLTAVCMPYLGSATLCDLLDRVLAGAPPADPGAWNDLTAGSDPATEPVPHPLPAEPTGAEGSFEEAVRLLGAQLADALAFVHAQGICHQDLKPSNVLLTPGGRPVLMDFNLSADPRRGSPVVGGTVPYMAPERLRALIAEVKSPPPAERRSDIYSLGVLLYELLTGRHPFGPMPVAGVVELGRHVLECQNRGFRRLRRANPRVRRGVARVVERCLAANPADRPTAAEAAAALREVPRLRRVRRLLRAYRGLVAAVLAATVISGGFGAWALFNRDPYAVRLLNKGLAARAAGDFDLAERYVGEAIHEGLTGTDMYLLHARLCQRVERFAEAARDYALARDQGANGPDRARLGYCLSRIRNYPQAVYRYNEAIAAGYAPAAVWNNCGHGWLESTRVSVDERFPRAFEALTKAIDRDPSLRAARHNRALLCYQISCKLGNQARAGIPTGRDAVVRGLEDVREAIRLGPPAAELYQLAARLGVLAARYTPSADAAAQPIADLEMALALGADPQALATDVSLSPLTSDPRFKALVARAAVSVNNAHTADRLVDPSPTTSDPR